MRINEFLYNLTNLREKYEQITYDEEHRTQEKGFGISSILSSVICVLFSLVSLTRPQYITEPFMFTLSLILIGIFVIIGVPAALFYSVYALKLQFALNKSPVRWLAAVVLIVSLILTAAIIYFACS